jgi:hypothetical protein
MHAEQASSTCTVLGVGRPSPKRYRRCRWPARTLSLAILAWFANETEGGMLPDRFQHALTAEIKVVTVRDRRRGSGSLIGTMRRVRDVFRFR